MSIEQNIKNILYALGEDITRDGLIKTPKRVEKAYSEIFSGYKLDAEETLNSAIFSSKNSEIILIKDIKFYSMCEHHMIPFFGLVHVGYIPNGKIIGLSKIPRVVDIFSKRLQVQENLTEDIADAIDNAINPSGVAVAIEGRHFCMEMRGIKSTNSTTITSSFRNEFNEKSKKEEFFNLIKYSSF